MGIISFYWLLCAEARLGKPRFYSRFPSVLETCEEPAKNKLLPDSLQDLTSQTKDGLSAPQYPDLAHL